MQWKALIESQIGFSKIQLQIPENLAICVTYGLENCLPCKPLERRFGLQRMYKSGRFGQTQNLVEPLSQGALRQQF